MTTSPNMFPTLQCTCISSISAPGWQLGTFLCKDEASFTEVTAAAGEGGEGVVVAASRSPPPRHLLARRRKRCEGGGGIAAAARGCQSVRPFVGAAMVRPFDFSSAARGGRRRGARTGAGGRVFRRGGGAG